MITNKYLKAFMALFIIAILSSCASKVPFSKSIMTRYDVTEADLSKMQFYTSDEIILKRAEAHGTGKKTEDGVLTISKGKDIEEIVIKKNTPCLIQKIANRDQFMMNFGDGNKYLVFGTMNQSSGYYTFQASEYVNGQGKVNYGNVYYLANTNSKYVHLNFKMKNLRDVNVKRSTVKGKKI